MRRLARLLPVVCLAAAACSDRSSPLEGESAQAARGKPPSSGLVEEGRRLFFEETFGGNGRTCGTCHPAPDLTLSPEDIAALPPDDPVFVGALDVDESVSNGLFVYPLGGTLLEPDLRVRRGVPSVVNVDITGPFTADGRAVTLQEQALEAVLLHALDGAVDRDGERIPTRHELEALAAFQESLQEPEKDYGVRAKGKLAERGKELFNGKAACVVCHFGPTFTDNDFHGTVSCPPRCPGEGVDTGRCRIDPGANDCATGGISFNTPQLRGVRNTAPYFHNNVSPTLRRVVEFYNGPLFSNSPSAQRLGIGPLNLTEQEIDELVAFLEAL